MRQIEVVVRASVTTVGQKKFSWLVATRLASLRRGGRRRQPLHKQKPPLNAGALFLTGLEENFQAQLHVEGFAGSDAGGSVEVANGVGDCAAARIGGA